MSGGKKWTERERQILRNAYDDPDIKIIDIAGEMNRSRWGIICEAKRFGLKKALLEVPPPRSGS
jgi:hypothetical protein